MYCMIYIGVVCIRQPLQTYDFPFRSNGFTRKWMAGKSDIGNFPRPGTTPTDSGAPENLHIFQQIALVNSVRTAHSYPNTLMCIR